MYRYIVCKLFDVFSINVKYKYNVIRIMKTEKVKITLYVSISVIKRDHMLGFGKK